MKSFGTVELKTVGAKGGYNGVAPLHWCIKAEPHVRLRLKRVFARIDKSADGAMVLLDTPEIGRELAWFLQRYPMELTEAGRRHLGRRSAEHVEREELVHRVLANDYQPEDVSLALPPRDYQRVGIDLAIRSRSLLLADEVGLGKTVEGIGLMTAKGALPALVVTLTHLPRQWEREIARFAPDLRVFIPRTTDPAKDIPKRDRKSPLFGPNVYILNYHKLAGWADYLAGRVRSVIFDEIQELRRDDSAKYRSAKQITVPATYRLGLSATPLYNYGNELYNVIDVLSPDALGSREEFSREWCSDRSIKDPKAFGTYLRDEGLMLRRTRAEVGRELPGLTIIPVEIDCDRAALDEVEDAASELARIILAQGGYTPHEKLRASEELSWRLRQATGIAKARPVAEFVKILVEQGERVTMFGWHREVYNLLEKHLEDLKPVFVTGEESPTQKNRSLERFKAKETDVLIMSLRAGAGIDGLQHACRTVVVAELDWSPGVLDQCVGRIARDGQRDPVVVYVLISSSGSDPVVADSLGLKRQQSDGVLNPGADLIEKLTVDPGHIKRLAERHLANANAKHKQGVAG
jgi:SNF2 family DNA or RNA helicase